MTSTYDPLPDDVETLKALLLAERAARVSAEAQARTRALEIEQLKFTIAKLRRERFGASSERGARLLDQLELQLADLEETAAQDETAVQIASPSARTTEVNASLYQLRAAPITLARPWFTVVVMYLLSAEKPLSVGIGVIGNVR